MKLFIGSDHDGFKLKERLRQCLSELGFEVEDLGNRRLEPGDDYPDYALKVARQVAETGQRGILICASGVGMAIAANKVKGVRAVNAYSPKIAEVSRRHNDTNVLCLGQDYLNLDTAREVVKTWLETEFSPDPRHHRRVEKIERLDAIPSVALHRLGVKRIIPTILTDDTHDLESKIQIIESVTDWVQIDVVDGFFASSRTVLPADLEELGTNLKIEWDLMVSDPLSMINDCVRVGANRILFHLEVETRISSVAGAVREKGIEVGLALNPETPVGLVRPYLGEVSVVQLLTVPPGSQGNQFLPESIKRITELKQIMGESGVKVQVDGGIKLDSVQRIVDAGADNLVVGSAIWQSQDIEKTIAKLKEVVAGVS